MHLHQIEAWTLRIIQQVESKRPHEDARVELKAQWPEAQKAARRIAGHANAAQGEPILWLIGVDEKSGVCGADHSAIATWFATVRAEFNGVTPAMQDLNVPWKHGMVVALLFDTTRAPFVVKNPVYGQKGGGPVSLEVPWREGTEIRSADRSELLRMLSPLQSAPAFDILNGYGLATFDQSSRGGSGDALSWSVRLTLYAMPMEERSVVIPFHRCSATIEIEGVMAPVECDALRLNGPEKSAVERALEYETKQRLPDEAVRATRSELVVDGPGKVYIEAWTTTQLSDRRAHSGALLFIVSLSPVGVSMPVVISASLTPQSFRFKSTSLWAAWTLNGDIDLSEYNEEPQPPMSQPPMSRTRF